MPKSVESFSECLHYKSHIINDLKAASWDFLARFRAGLRFCIIKWQPHGGNMLIVLEASQRVRHVSGVYFVFTMVYFWCAPSGEDLVRQWHPGPNRLACLPAWQILFFFIFRDVLKDHTAENVYHFTLGRVSFYGQDLANTLIVGKGFYGAAGRGSTALKCIALGNIINIHEHSPTHRCHNSPMQFHKLRLGSTIKERKNHNNICARQAAGVLLCFSHRLDPVCLSCSPVQLPLPPGHLSPRSAKCECW